MNSNSKKKKRGRKRGSSVGSSSLKKTRALGESDVLESETSVFAKWQDGTSHEAVVLSARGEDQDKEYYLHFVKYDRRMDQWVSRDRIESVVVLTKEEEEKRKKKKKKEHDKHSKKDEMSLRAKRKQWEEEHHKITEVKNIQTIQIGDYEIDTWYFSPYPEEFCNSDRMFVCEFCLKYMKRAKTYADHRKTCTLRHPPGNEIFRDGKLSVFEVDGVDNKLYVISLHFAIYITFQSTPHDISYMQVLSKSLPALETVPRSQDLIFRRRSFSFLRSH